MKHYHLWLSEYALDTIKAAVKKRGFEIEDEIIGEGKGSVVFAVKNNSTLCVKVRPYFTEAVKRVYYSRAVYWYDRKRFPYLPLPDPNRKIEYLLNSDELAEECKDSEVEAIVSDRAYLATIRERLYPIRSLGEQELLRLTCNICEALDKLYDLSYAVHGIGKEDIRLSQLSGRYVISDCSKISRFIDCSVRYRYSDPSSSAPELFEGRYYETSAVFSLGYYLRQLIVQGDDSEKVLTDNLDKINSAIHPAVILETKKNLKPLKYDGFTYSPAFIRLINDMTSYFPEDRPAPKSVFETARELLDTPPNQEEDEET